jgi:mono/diheme cytochrome c family protein
MNSEKAMVPAIALALVITTLLTGAQPVQEQDSKSAEDNKNVYLIPSLEGADLFHSYCASCHGADGRGEGPAARALTAKVPDLTTIAKRNGGIFPARRIERVISGDDLVVAHGSREMPIWGPIFHQIEKDRDLGNVRLRNVAKYIQSIQQK